MTPTHSPALAGQVAIVTGASSGLGVRFAAVLAEAGAAVALVGRRASRLEDVASDIRARGGRCCVCPCDVTDATGLKTMVDQVENELGLVGILVNNAGIPDAELATRMSTDLIDRVLATNLRAPFILATEVARRLIKAQRGGRIVNISSMAAYQYDGNGAALYATTKAGVVRMTEALAVEWACFEINVNAIAPGYFESEMTAAMQERVGDIARHLPRGRLGRPEQLDSTLLYLCSPASECVTGTVVKVDDGQMPR